MNENQIKEAIGDVKLADEKKDELWEQIRKRAHRKRAAHRRVAVAAAVIFVLLILPGGVYAAGRFSWIWEEEESGNQQLNNRFKPENAYAEAGGFGFRIEQAWCDNNMGVAYFYVAVTDVSGAGRNPADHDRINGEENPKEGDIFYDIRPKGCSSSQYTYDKKNSTREIAYYYIDGSAFADDNMEDINEIEVIIWQVDQVDDGSIYSTQTQAITMKIKNVIPLPALIWNMEMNGKRVEVRVAPIIAHIRNGLDPEFEIVCRDGTEIKDYFEDETEDGTIAEHRFTLKGSGDASEYEHQTYRFSYIDINNISGIRLNGQFYPVEEATLSPAE